MCYSTTCVFYTIHTIYPVCILYNHLYRTRTVRICHTGQYIYCVYHTRMVISYAYRKFCYSCCIRPWYVTFHEIYVNIYLHTCMGAWHCFCIYTVASYIHNSYVCLSCMVLIICRQKWGNYFLQFTYYYYLSMYI